MAKTADTTTTSAIEAARPPAMPGRRNLMGRSIGAIAGAIVLSGGPVIAARPVIDLNADHELLQLCGEFVRLTAEMCDLYDVDTPEAQERARQLGRYLHDGSDDAEGLAWTIASIPAKTPEGRIARAELLWDGCEDFFSEEQEDWDSALMASVLRDARAELAA